MAYPLPQDPSGINAAGNASVFFVPALVDPTKPTIAELDAGINLSNVLYAFAPAVEQGTTERVKYGYNSVVESLAKPKFSIESWEYDVDPQSTGLGTEYGAQDILVRGVIGYVLDRRGLGPNEPFAAGQKARVLPVELGVQAPAPIDPRAESEKHRVIQKVGVRGEVIEAVVAAA